MRAKFILIIFLISGVAQGNAYRCYECWSILAPGCSEPFKPNATQVSVVPAGAGQCCGALRMTNDDGRDAIARNVVEVGQCTMGENKCHSTKNNSITTTMCCCSADLCNGHSFTSGFRSFSSDGAWPIAASSILYFLCTAVMSGKDF